jgi:hypothetical protein
LTLERTEVIAAIAGARSHQTSSRDRHQLLQRLEHRFGIAVFEVRGEGLTAPTHRRKKVVARWHRHVTPKPGLRRICGGQQRTQILSGLRARRLRERGQSRRRGGSRRHGRRRGSSARADSGRGSELRRTLHHQRRSARCESRLSGG